MPKSANGKVRCDRFSSIKVTILGTLALLAEKWRKCLLRRQSTVLSTVNAPTQSSVKAFFLQPTSCWLKHVQTHGPKWSIYRLSIPLKGKTQNKNTNKNLNHISRNLEWDIKNCFIWLQKKSPNMCEAPEITYWWSTKSGGLNSCCSLPKIWVLRTSCLPWEILCLTL